MSSHDLLTDDLHMVTTWDELRSFPNPISIKGPTGEFDQIFKSRANVFRCALLSVSLSQVTSKASFFQVAMKALSFPPYAMPNWDSFNELLHDFSWVKSTRIVILWKSYDDFEARLPALAIKLRQVCSIASDDGFNYEARSIVHCLSFSHQDSDRKR